MPWVETERRALAETLSQTSPTAPTLCAGWDARHLLAHLVQREQSPAASVGDIVVRREPGQERFLGKLADQAQSPAGYQALVQRFLAGPPRWSPMSWAGENLNLVEYVVHHEDVRRGAGPAEPRTLPPAESAAIAAKLGVFGRLGYRASPVGVALSLPGGSPQVVRKGPDTVTIVGEAPELALYVSGRRAAAAVELQGQPQVVARFQEWVATR